MNAFQRMARRPPKCDICGGPMLAVYGHGWDNDRIVCGDVRICGAEIVFPTSTPPSEERKKKGVPNE